MKKQLLVTALMIATATLITVAQADAKGKFDGKAGFLKNCAVCHKDGGNIITPAKTLKKETLAKNGVKDWKDIVAKMRNPGPGMTKFEPSSVPDKEAKAIAEYVLKTFK